MTRITQYASPGGASQRHVLGNTRHREEPPSDAYWVIHVTGRNLRILTVNTNNWVWGFNLHNNNVNAMHLARTYWGIPSSSFEIGGQYHLPPSACGLRGSGWYWPPISQDSDGIPQYVLARCMVFLQCAYCARFLKNTMTTYTMAATYKHFWPFLVPKL